MGLRGRKTEPGPRGAPRAGVGGQSPDHAGTKSSNSSPASVFSHILYCSFCRNPSADDVLMATECARAARSPLGPLPAALSPGRGQAAALCRPHRLQGCASISTPAPLRASPCREENQDICDRPQSPVRTAATHLPWFLAPDLRARAGPRPPVPGTQREQVLLEEAWPASEQPRDSAGPWLSRPLHRDRDRAPPHAGSLTHPDGDRATSYAGSLTSLGTRAFQSRKTSFSLSNSRSSSPMVTVNRFSSKSGSCSFRMVAFFNTCRRKKKRVSSQERDGTSSSPKASLPDCGEEGGPGGGSTERAGGSAAHLPRGTPSEQGTMRHAGQAVSGASEGVTG